MLTCPKCSAQMERINVANIEIDRCTACRGLWFDICEADDLKQHATSIDTGDADVGQRYNATDRIDCPVCPNTRLLRLVDPQQPHIWFESCPVCYGRFFDAGEFRDFAELQFGDLIKRWKIKQARA
jgi:Zn-finger nucleic acid-binding protein